MAPHLPCQTSIISVWSWCNNGIEEVQHTWSSGKHNNHGQQRPWKCKVYRMSGRSAAMTFCHLLSLHDLYTQGHKVVWSFYVDSYKSSTHFRSKFWISSKHNGTTGSIRLPTLRQGLGAYNTHSEPSSWQGMMLFILTFPPLIRLF